MKKLEPEVKLPFGHPNGYVLYNDWVKNEEQELDNVRRAFAIFEKNPMRVFSMRQYILQGIGSALIVTSPLKEYPFHVFMSHDTYFDFFYVISDKGVEKDAPWMYKSPSKFLKDLNIPITMNDVQAEEYARHITRKRSR